MLNIFRKIKSLFSREDKKLREYRWTFAIMLAGAAIGLLASFVLSIEAITLAKNANAVLPCSINEALNCAAVGRHESSGLLGFPNSFIGMMTIPVIITIAVAGLAKVKFPRWFMFCAWLGSLVGLIFAIWMFYMSYVVIQVLCPWCLTLDVGMILIFFATTKYAVRENLFNFSKKISSKLNRAIDRQFDWVILVLLLLIPVIMIISKFGRTIFLQPSLSELDKFGWMLISAGRCRNTELGASGYLSCID